MKEDLALILADDRVRQMRSNSGMGIGFDWGFGCWVEQVRNGRDLGETFLGWNDWEYWDTI